MSNALEAALDYLSRGWMPVPIPHGSKKPNLKEWQKLRLSREDVPRYFNNGQNVGVLLGEPSGGLVDIDIDCSVALSIADAILPATPMVSGRASAPSSHRWYICDPIIATTKRNDPSLASTDDRASIVEFRSTGGQTVVPPSIHPTNEPYVWQGELSPARVNGNELLKAVCYLAACALVARHWQRGKRHDTALALAGTLLRAGWARNKVEEFIRYVAIAAKDEELEDRIRLVEGTEQKIKNGQKTTGLPSLSDLLGDKVTSSLQKWLDLRSSNIEQRSDPRETVLVTRRCLADVQPEQVDFLWYPYIPKGKLTLIEGDPGVGKSWLTCAFAAATAAGAGPDGWMQGSPGNVLMLGVEDGLADTIRPRLDAMQADVKRIFALEGALILNDIGLLTLEAEISEVCPMLVVIDPLVAYLGAGVDLHRANETRAVMSRLAKLAETYHCAIVSIRHLTKGGKDRAIYRGVGSIDFTASCRSALLVGSDPDNSNSRAIVHIKSNLTEMGCAVGYKISQGRFYWTGTSDLTAGRILASVGNEEKGSALRTAEDFLREVLSDGPRASKEIDREAKEAGITKITLNRAKQSLGVKARKEGRPGENGQHWVWVLPEKPEGNHEESQVEEDDNLRASPSYKGINTSQLAEGYHPRPSDN